MKVYCVLFFCALPLFSTAQLINNGVTIIVSAGTNLVLDNLSLQNNGTFDQAAGTVAFTGGTNAFIGGSVTPGFYVLQLNKPAATLQLERGIVLHNQLQFTNGLINLNNNIVLLDPAALLTGESETSHISGTSGGYVQITKTLNVPSADDPGNLGAVISSTANLGPVIIRRGHQSQVNPTGGGNSILRYYDIISTNNSALNATLRIKYFDGELNGLNENNLSIWKREVTGKWNNLSKTSGNATSNYIEQSSIADLTRFTLSTFGNALPLIWSSFNTQCVSGQVRITWKTEQEQNTAQFTILRSTDARNWIKIASLPAAGNSNSTLSYTYTDQQPASGITYYQIRQQDFDGRITLSPVLMNNCGVSEELKVLPNPVQSDCLVSIQLARSGNLLMQLFDGKGALVQTSRESVQNGSNQFQLRLRNLAAGIYTLVVTRPDGVIKVVKIEKY